MKQNKTWEQTFASLQPKSAPKTYCIAFTPRSGSTWLGDILTRSGNLGDPKEYFNLEAASYIINNSNCQSLYQYYQYLKSVKQTNGVFGAEISLQHLAKLADEGYEQIIGDIGAWFFLRRRDYVAQAVSLYRASQSGVYHSYQQVGAVPEVPYNKNQIGRYALTAMASEYRITGFFSSRALSPRALWYEELVTMGPAEVIALFAADLGITLGSRQDRGREQQDTSFEKVSDQYSLDMIARFKADNPAFIEYWDTYRGLKTPGQFKVKHPSYMTMVQLFSGALAGMQSRQ